MTKLRIVIDGEISKIAPPLSEDEAAQLRENLLESRVCRDPLVVWKEHGILLDGHNRYKICREEGIKFNVIGKSLGSRDEAKAWVLRHQLGRRNLDAPTRLKMAHDLRPLMARIAEANQKAGAKTQDAGGTDKKIGELAGVSSETARKFSYVEDHGDEDTVSAMEGGGLSVDAAFKKVKEQQKPKPKPDKPKTPYEQAMEDCKPLKDIQRTIQDARAMLKELQTDPIATFVNFQAVDNELKNAWQGLKFGLPHGVCPYCGGDGCKACSRRGWLPEAMFKAAPKELREAVRAKQ